MYLSPELVARGTSTPALALLRSTRHRRLLGGRMPFASDELSEMVRVIQENAPPWLAAISYWDAGCRLA